jgi:hypothetical protein
MRTSVSLPQTIPWRLSESLQGEASFFRSPTTNACESKREEYGNGNHGELHLSSPFYLRGHAGGGTAEDLATLQFRTSESNDVPTCAGRNTDKLENRPLSVMLPSQVFRMI